MPIKVPRLVRDNKTGIFYFRYTLPRQLAIQAHQTSINASLRIRNNKQARAMACLPFQTVKIMPDLLSFSGIVFWGEVSPV